MHKFWTGTAVALTLCVWSCGKSETATREEVRDYLSQPENVARVEAFVLANARFALFHELAHFLVDQYGISTFGADEIAPDRLAIWEMMPKRRLDGSPPELWDAALNPDSPQLLWVLQFWEYVADKQLDIAYLDKHPPGKQRAGQIACLLYGADPDRFVALIERYRGGQAEKDACIADAAKNARDWGNVVLPNLENLGRDEAKRRLNMAFPFYGEETFPQELQISVANRVAPVFFAGDFLKKHMVLDEIAELIRRLKPPPERGLPAAQPGETELHRIVRWEQEQQVKVFSVNNLDNAEWVPSMRKLEIGYPLVYEFVTAGRNMLVYQRKGSHPSEKVPENKQ